MDEISKILIDLEASRHAIRRDVAGFKSEIDLGAKARRVVAKHPLRWLGGAAFAGFILSRPGRRSKSVRGKSIAAPAKAAGFFGFLLALMKMAFPLVRPALSAYAANRIADLANRVR